MTDSVTHDCGSCGETVSIDAVRCPNCESALLASKRLIVLFGAIGALVLPFSIWFLQRVLVDGIPAGLGMAVLYGVGIGVALLGPLLIGAAVAGLIQRRRILGRTNADSMK